MNLYFDNASTSFPKPPEVARAVASYIDNCSGTYSRASYGRVVESTSIVEQCRDKLALALGVNNPESLFFTMNATTAANTVIKGLELTNCRVLVSPMEHNAIMRPLQFLTKKAGIKIELLPADNTGRVDTEELTKIDRNNVALVVVNHRSNVNGVIQPVEQISHWAAEIPIMIDATQSVGYTDLLCDVWDIDYMIFTAHKGLHAPTGVGGFYAKDPNSITPYIHGGTGSHSESFDMPELYPDRFEAGTPNIAGIAGLLAGLENRPKPRHTFDDFTRCMARLRQIDGLTIYASQMPDNPLMQAELFSFTHSRVTTSQLCARLFNEFNCETRQGLQCAPLAHKTIGTFPHGTVRVSLSPYHTIEDLAFLYKAIETICK